MKIAVRILIAILVVLCILPALDVGFLADDFYMGDRIARARADNPGAPAAIADAFRLRWTESFDVFRPVTILSLSLDYALFGADPSRHHLQSIALWLLFAFLAGHAASLFSAKNSFAVEASVTAIAGCWPAGIESVAWLVAREDLFCGIAALAALILLLRCPSRPWMYTAAVAFALCSKETAVILPPLLLLSDCLIGRRHPAALEWKRLLRAHGPAFATLAVYLAVRAILFESIGGTYNQRSYFDYLGDPSAIPRLFAGILASLWKLVAPYNASAFERACSLPPPWPALLLILPLAALAISGGGARLLRHMPFLLAMAAWAIAPLILLGVPLGPVESTMEKSRFLLIPMIPLAILLGVLINRSYGRSPGRTLLLVSAIVLAGAGTFQVNFSSYAAATDRVNGVLESIRSLVAPGSRTLILNGEHPRTGSGVHPSLIFLEGCHVLSAGLFHATRPPFEPRPGRHLEPVLARDYANLQAIIDGRPGSTRPNILRFAYGDSGPRIERLGQAGHFGNTRSANPGHGSRLADGWDGEFRVATTRAIGDRFERGIVRIFEPGGARAEAAFARKAATIDADRSGSTIAARRLVFRMESTDGVFDAPMTRELAAALPQRYFVWWMSLYDGDDLLLRTPYALVYAGEP